MCSLASTKSLLALILLLWATASIGKVTFTAGLIPDGPVAPYQSGNVPTAEENQAEAKDQKENWDKMEENIGKDHREEMASDRELMNETAAQRVDARNKVEKFAESNSVEGASGTRVTTIYGDDGRMSGIASADQFKRSWIEIGKGENPDSWQKATDKNSKIICGGVVAEIDAMKLQKAKQWTLRLITEHKNGERREARFLLTLG